MDDFDAVKKGIVGKTVTGRAAGKVTGKGLGKQVKWMGIDPQGIDD